MNWFLWLLFVLFIFQTLSYLLFATGRERRYPGTGTYAIMAVISITLAIGVLIHGGML